MSKYRQLDSFHQPPQIADKFDQFVRRQAAAGYEPERTPDAAVRTVGTWAKSRVPHVILRNVNGYAGVRYSSEANVRQLDFRVLASPDGETRLWTSYAFAPHISGLVLAAEMQQAHLRKDNHLPVDTPQALASYLGRPLFERGRIEDLGDGSAYSVIGQGEFEALGRLLVGHSL